MTFEDPQELCAGRLRFTVPGPNATVHFETAYYNGSNLDWYVLRPTETFDTLWQNRLKELSTNDNKIISLLDNSAARKGAVSFLQDANQESYDMELWLHVNSAVLKTTSYAPPNRVTQNKEFMDAVLNSFQATTPLAVASGSFCIAGGSLSVAVPFTEGMLANVAIPLEKGGAVVLRAQTSLLQEPDASVEHLASDVNGLRATMVTHGVLVHVLKNSKRSIAGMNGQEIAFWSNDPDRPGHFLFAASFAFNGVVHDRYHPQTQIDFVGASYPDTIGHDRLFSLWNAVMDSTRLGR